jgi:hypothetical protein
MDFINESEGIDAWRELAETGLAARISGDAFVASAHEAFRLLYFRSQNRDIVGLDIYLNAIAELRLPSAWADRLPCRVEGERLQVLLSPERWVSILRDCVARAGDDSQERDALFTAALRVALRETGVNKLDETDPRTIEARQTVADAPAFVRDSALALSDQYAIARLLMNVQVDPTLALEAARDACDMLEDRNRMRDKGVPAGVPLELVRLLKGLSPTTAFEAALSRLHHEQEDVRRGEPGS